MVIKENFLEQSKFNKIKEFLESPLCPWHYNSSVVYKGEQARLKYNFQFTHNFIKPENQDSDFLHILEDLITKISPKRIIRIKANLVWKTPEIIEHGFHVDYLEKCKTAILYINSNNGYTKFEDGTIVQSKENTFVEFDSNLRHTGTSCTDKNRRIVINLNYDI